MPRDHALSQAGVPSPPLYPGRGHPRLSEQEGRVRVALPGDPQLTGRRRPPTLDHRRASGERERANSHPSVPRPARSPPRYRHLSRAGGRAAEPLEGAAEAALTQRAPEAAQGPHTAART